MKGKDLQLMFCPKNIIINITDIDIYPKGFTNGRIIAFDIMGGEILRFDFDDRSFDLVMKEVIKEIQRLCCILLSDVDGTSLKVLRL